MTDSVPSKMTISTHSEASLISDGKIVGSLRDIKWYGQSDRLSLESLPIIQDRTPRSIRYKQCSCGEAINFELDSQRAQSHTWSDRDMEFRGAGLAKTYKNLLNELYRRDTLLVHPETWQALMPEPVRTEDFCRMWDAYKEAAEKKDGFRDALDIVLESQSPEPDVWFVTPHDLRTSRSGKTIGYQLERSGWSSYD